MRGKKGIQGKGLTELKTRQERGRETLETKGRKKEKPRETKERGRKGEAGRKKTKSAIIMGNAKISKMAQHTRRHPQIHN